MTQSCRIHAFPDIATGTVTYVVADGSTNSAAIIDPVLDYDPHSGEASSTGSDRVLDCIREHGLTIEWILETHVHADHLSGAHYLGQHTGGRIAISEKICEVQQTFRRLHDPEPGFPVDGSQFDHLFQDGETFRIGQLEATAMLVPGHTPADLAYLIGDAVFVGDTLFMPELGSARTDFPGGDARTLYRSIQRLLALPPETRMFVCHDYPPQGGRIRWETTVAAQRAGNIHVRDGIDEETFVADGLEAWLVHDALIRAARKPLQAGADPMPACDAELDRMLSRGELAFGGAGLLQAHRSRELMLPLFAEYQGLLAEWPHALPDPFELRHGHAATPGLAGWLGGLRRNDAGGLARLEMQATQLVKARDRQWRDEKLIGHWLWHLAANGAGLPLTTVVVSPAGTARFEPIEAPRASAWLDALLRAWAEGMRRPLPIKAEFARPVLTALPLGDLPRPGTDAWRALLASDKLLARIRDCHANGWNQPGRRESPYEARAYPTLDSLFAGGELVEWALTLYEPLFLALRSKQERESATEAE